MNSLTTEDFWGQYHQLPKRIRQRARVAYQQSQNDPRHPGLQFKRVHPALPLYSARITEDYRAVGLLDGDTVVWDFIRTHHEYVRYLNSF